MHHDGSVLGERLGGSSAERLRQALPLVLGLEAASRRVGGASGAPREGPRDTRAVGAQYGYFVVPDSASEVQLWFTNTDRYGCNRFDSDYGRNFSFDVN